MKKRKHRQKKNLANMTVAETDAYWCRKQQQNFDRIYSGHLRFLNVLSTAVNKLNKEIQ